MARPIDNSPPWDPRDPWPPEKGPPWDPRDPWPPEKGPVEPAAPSLAPSFATHGGGPAYPQTVALGPDGGTVTVHGLTKRQVIAMHILAGVLAGRGTTNAYGFVEDALLAADRLLEITS